MVLSLPLRYDSVLQQQKNGLMLFSSCMLHHSSAIISVLDDGELRSSDGQHVSHELRVMGDDCEGVSESWVMKIKTRHKSVILAVKQI
jgi:hypothetical protein